MIRQLLALVVLLFATSLALADGLIIIHNPPFPVPDHFQFAPLEVRYHHVDVEIKDNVAITSIDQEFHNPSSARLEGTFIFPLPEGAHIDKFSMDIAGHMEDAELLDADKARSLYEEIVRKQRDPALLEYVGRGAFKVRIFPIEPNSNKQIKIRYTQLLKTDSGLTEYVYPLNTEKFSSRPLNDVSVKVQISGARPIKTIYSPSHDVDVHRHGDSSATAAYEEHNARPDRDFRLIFTQDRQPVDLRLLTYKKAGDEGFFLLMASPGTDIANDRVQPRDICFVADTSGSMSGEKIKQLKKALRFCIDNLNPNDRFQIIRFSTEAQPLWDELTKATPVARDKANEFVDGFKATGGTAIEEAIRKSIALRGGRDSSGAERPYVIIFLTDGQPTVGETNEDKLVELAKSDAKTRIFTFGIGDDINTHLLDRIAEKTNAFTTYVGAHEDIEIKVSSFFAGIQAPVLTDVQVHLAGEGIRTMDVLPKTTPDLFRGQTLYLFGRYSGHGPGAVTLNGQCDGKTRSFSNDVTFTDEAGRNDGNVFIAQLWATRRVGWLLDEIRLHGESAELKDEVTRLAREYGIVTPYTAYLILEDEQRRRVPFAFQTMRELGADQQAAVNVRDFYNSARADSASLARTGPRGVENARAMQEMKLAATAAPQAAQPSSAMAKGGFGGGIQAGGGGGQTGGYRQMTNYAQQSRLVNGRSFYQNSNVWTDGTVQSQQNLKTQQVKFGSDEYFALMRQDRNLAAWLSLGTDVDVTYNGVLYQVRQ